MEPILKVEALTKTFSGQREIAAVNGISFELFPGECLAIIGESGSGKSTLADALKAKLGDRCYVINQDALKRSMELLAKGIEAYNNK